MLYIHKLSDFNDKSADIESITIVRDLKGKIGFPVTQTYLERCFSDYFITENDIMLMENSLALIGPTRNMVEGFAASNNPFYEPVNLQRVLQIINSIPGDLSNSVAYAKEMFAYQRQIVFDLVPILNAIPSLRAQEDKISVNKTLNMYFDKILRHREPASDFDFRYLDIIHESHLSGLTGLEESMKKGFLFHITLEEELKKLDFFEIKSRIPPELLKNAEDLEKNIFAIRKGVEKAYLINMQMLNYAVMMYSCIKWVSSRAVQY